MLSRKYKKLLEHKLNEIFEDIADDIGGVDRRIDRWAERHQELTGRLNHLEEHLANNGVIRDLRKLEKEVETLRDAMDGVRGYLEHLNTNGVAEAINKLNKEVFADKKSDMPEGFMGAIYALSGAEVNEDPTLAGKVDAIIEHLGIDVTVKPKQVTESKIEVKKKPNNKKKGKK